MTADVLVEPPRSPDPGQLGAWNGDFALVLLHFGAERFGWTKPVEHQWPVRLCEVCWCGSPKSRPCWYCELEGVG